ncbi:MAG: aminotransferase class I/II-fold pyridoxal phosphate-dependent enzyme, partial [Acidimicrobiales bacterium]
LGVPPAEILDLSASLNPLAPDVTSIAGAHLDALGRYPDPQPATAALATAIGTHPDRLLLTNGGAEAIALVAAELGGHAIEPEFALHPRHPRGQGPRWRSNPHNPSGRLASPADHAGVWDEAFYPLATGRWTRGDGVVVGSLTKLFACPGLRLGYVLAGPALIERLRARQPAWSVNTLALATLPHLLALADLAAWAAAITQLRAELAALLASHGLGPAPSDANWILCAHAPGLRRRLAPHGVLVRDATSFGLPGQARVAVPSPAGLARLEEALCAAG